MNANPAHTLNASTPGYVCRRLAAIPDLSALHARYPQRYPHLLASVARGTPRARYDILFAFPGDSLTLDADHWLSRNGRLLGTGDFLDALDREWRQQSTTVDQGAIPTDAAPPFTGGWFVFLGYELVSQIEPTVTGIRHDSAFPVACATRIPAAIIIDHLEQHALFVCETERASEILPMLEADTQSPTIVNAEEIAIAQVHEEEPARFLEHVRRVQDYIRAGDVFQVNLSRKWRIPLRVSVNPISLYRRLCATNPAPFAGLMTLGNGRAVISSSPERLVEVRGRTVRTRPIAGTYPRSQDPGEDEALSRDLLRHPKERAEHVMLIDLERNDLGRVCRTGSIQVKEFMALESYRHVHHIVSEVNGELRDDVTPAQVIRAVFPGGTITGCPKVRCMQIIAALEQAPRTAYTGSMGYLNRDGSLDMNILIRTLIQNENEISLRAGAGIVADSIPERELAETRAKAKGMLAALGLAV
ncbi:MAG: aminodeoxychorismate synthase component I [Sulfuricaulis sp.]|uniref:aminodeoxychorismate synthase component I n=1 Tax=Sulfuricaulis sp. TaxID=2003553 RepID=UPI003C493752